MTKIYYRLATLGFLLLTSSSIAATGVIEKQLEEIGKIDNEEVVVVQRQYTKKGWRHEFTPVAFGGIPFGTVRRTLFGGASYILHVNDWLGLQLFDFAYTKTFFSSFTDDINNNKERTQGDIKPDYQKLLYFLDAGIQVTPFYGKASTFSRWIAYLEPYLSLTGGLAKTESNTYFAVVPGIGLRVFFKEWFSMRLDFRDYIYTEQYLTRTNPSTTATALRNNYAVMVSLSFWLPKMPR